MAEIPSTSTLPPQSSHLGLKRVLSGIPLGSPPAIRPRLDISAPASPETDDATMDKVVLHNMARMGWGPEYIADRPLLVNLLFYIAGVWKDPVEAVPFLEDKSLLSQLTEAWKKKSFRDIRQYGRRSAFQFRSSFQSRLV
jgi:hypothetical protein